MSPTPYTSAPAAEQALRSAGPAPPGPRPRAPSRRRPAPAPRPSTSRSAGRRPRPARRAPRPRRVLEQARTTAAASAGAVAGREQVRRAAVVQHPAERAEVAGDDGRARAHRLDQHDPEALAAGVRRDVARPPSAAATPCRVVQRPEQLDRARRPPAAGPRAPRRRPRGRAPGTGRRAVPRQHRRHGGGAAPAAPCAARRAGRGTRPSAARRAGPARRGRRGGEPVDVHAVRDHDRVAAEVLDDGRAARPRRPRSGR